jgi:hypothetical protein
MADELRDIPGVVQRGDDGFDRIDEPRLTMANTSQIGTLTRQGAMTKGEVDSLNERLDALEGDPESQRRVARGGAPTQRGVIASQQRMIQGLREQGLSEDEIDSVLDDEDFSDEERRALGRQRKK